jgi:predicted dienelactone hydrolase
VPAVCTAHERRSALRFAAAIAVLFSLVALPAFAFNAGFEEVRIPNGAEPPLVAGVWYPTDAPVSSHALDEVGQTVAPGAPVAGIRLPLVVISHGGAGWYDSHSDTAIALARAGFVAAAISHAGDTFKDQSRVLQLWRRPDQLHRLVDYMLDHWRGQEQVDASRIGAFGFSNGGFTVLVAAGGTPDLLKVAPFCEVHPHHDLCETLQQAHVDADSIAHVPTNAWVHDLRIKAVVIAAPAFGFAFGKRGLRDVHAPVQLWSAAADRHQPHPAYDEPVRDDLPRAPDYRVVPNAGHYDFLPPCDARLSRLRPEICESQPGFDRAAFHEQFNADVVRFFQIALQTNGR